MRVMLRWILAALALAFATVPVAVAQERRIALLVGNAAYSDKVGALRNPENDIEGIREALIAAGFMPADIRVVANTTRLQLKREVDAFASRAASLSSSDLAFFYYSGHGAWRPGARGMSLIPVDATDASTDDFWYSTVNLDDEVMRAFSASQSQAAWIVAIDACRNELRLPMRTLGGGDKAFQALPSQAGMLISFAADEGQTARDIAPGERYSPYAAALIEGLSRPGLSASSLFGALRPSVIRRTGGAQQPVLTNKLNVDPVLHSAVVPSSAMPIVSASPSMQAAVSTLFLDARTTPATTPAPFIRVDPKTLPDFALFKECNGCPEMVIIPGDSFTMGSTEGDPNEQPVRQVNIRRFAISRFETTWDEWDACVSVGRCNGSGPEAAASAYDASEGRDLGWGNGRRPAIFIDWNDARTFADFASSRTGGVYRLPSEAEWEYAARAGSGDRYAWGPVDPVCDEQAFNGANFQECSDDRTRPVGSFRANGYGLFDLHGNVWEWVEDCYENSYAAGQAGDGSPFTGGPCQGRVYRGGSWYFDSTILRSSNRSSGVPTLRDDNVGFRLSRML